MTTSTTTNYPQFEVTLQATINNEVPSTFKVIGIERTAEWAVYYTGENASWDTLVAAISNLIIGETWVVGEAVFITRIPDLIRTWETVSEEVIKSKFRIHVAWNPSRIADDYAISNMNQSLGRHDFDTPPSTFLTWEGITATDLKIFRRFRRAVLRELVANVEYERSLDVFTYKSETLARRTFEIPFHNTWIRIQAVPR